MNNANEHDRLRAELRRLEGVRGRAGTTCISVYVQAGHPGQLQRMRQTLAREASAAAQIKSAQTRKAVQSALASLRALLLALPALPGRGLAAFACADPAEGGQLAGGAFCVEPAAPVRRTLYWCDAGFDLAPLRAGLETHDRHGFVVVSGDGALLATQCGAEAGVLASWSTVLPNKQSNGGQSAARFARARV